MKEHSSLLLIILCAVLLATSCATSPETQARRQAVEDEIAAILSTPLDESQYGKAQRCLTDNQYRNFRALDDRRLLFEGRRDKLWLNTLRASCPDLRYASVLRVRSTFSTSRICEHDSFVPDDWFSWPWYRRWPWHWGSAWSLGVACTLGEFQPVTATQVEDIEAALARK